MKSTLFESHALNMIDNNRTTSLQLYLIENTLKDEVTELPLSLAKSRSDDTENW